MVRRAGTVWLVGAVATWLFLPNPAARVHGDGDGAAASLAVTVKYTGKGQVDSSHLLWIWLWNSPDFSKDAPFDGRTLDKNGGTVTFEKLGTTKVWITVVYDKDGTYDGQGPPPPGTPATVYRSQQGEPEAVTPGDNTRVTVSFDDLPRKR